MRATVTLAEETIDPREPEFARWLVRDNIETSWSDRGVSQRGQHAKTHGCADGEFVVLDGIPDIYRHGVFATGRKFRCQVRFSNGGESDDRKKDVRGLAIKLLDVDGLKLLPGQGAAREQDFILVDHPTYFTATTAEYLAFNRHFTPLLSLRRHGFSFSRASRAAFGVFALLLFHRPVLNRARQFKGRHAKTPLSLVYHSTTPYLLGPGTAVKYKAIGRIDTHGKTGSADGLSAALWSSLAETSATFDFGVVVQSDAIRHPVEDPSIDWEANDAQFVKLAVLTLPRQKSSKDRQATAATIRFNPWMSLAAHRPIGSINRLRLLIYDAMAKRRLCSPERPKVAHGNNAARSRSVTSGEEA